MRKCLYIKYSLVLALLILGITKPFAQNLDSLFAVTLKSNKADTSKIRIIEAVTLDYLNNGENDKAVSAAKQGIILAGNSKLKSKGLFLHFIGRAYYGLSDFSQAIHFYQQAFLVRESIGDSLGMAKTLGNMGNTYTEMADYSKALDLLLKCLKISEKIKDENVINNTLNSLGNIYKNTEDYDKALEYYSKSLAYEEKFKNKQGIGASLGNIAGIYNAMSLKMNQKKYDDTAIVFQEKANVLAKEVEDLYTLANGLNLLGSIYQKRADYVKALKYYEEGKKISMEGEDKIGELAAKISIATLYTTTNKLKEAEKLTLETVKLSKELATPEYELSAYSNLKDIYDKQNKIPLAYEAFKKYIQLKDTINSDASKKELVKHEMGFEFEKKEAMVKAEQDKKDAIAASEAKRQRLIIYAISFGLLMVLVLVVFVYRNLQNNKRKNKIIEAQKAEVEQKNELIEHKQKEILDSITYAKRLQEAILPPKKYVQDHLSQSFILYKPKDIVAGDFYWMESIDETVWIAAADCTGHGVPGAMVSVVCSNALNQSFREFGLREPGHILDKTRDLVLQTFSKSDKDVKDGMDISLCSLNTKTRELKWAGANNPLWYVQNGELKEVTAHKQPIGKTDNPVPFPTHTIQLASNDSLFLFTDGYADQFGGPKGKKLKYKKMGEDILSCINKPLEEQHDILELAFDDWKGELEQIDDVCMIGIRV